MKDLLKSTGQDYLLDSVSTLKGIGPKSSKTLSQASIESVLDLLLLLPRKYKIRDRWFKVDKSLLPRTITIEVLIFVFSTMVACNGVIELCILNLTLLYCSFIFVFILL